MAEDSVGTPEVSSDMAQATVPDDQVEEARTGPLLSQRAGRVWGYPPIGLLTADARLELADQVTAAMDRWDQLPLETRFLIEGAEAMAAGYATEFDAGQAWEQMYDEAPGSMTLEELLADDDS